VALSNTFSGRLAIVVLLVLLGVAILVPAWRWLTVPMLIGAVGGTLMRIFLPPRPQVPLKPLGRGWQAVWWVLVGLVFVSILVPIIRYFVPLLLIVILWGWLMHRYRKKMLGARP
jgi:hypothetical protein